MKNVNDWHRRPCNGCGGKRLVSSMSGEPMFCNSCEGSGAEWVHSSGAIAKWPGGPLTGRLSRESMKEAGVES